MLLKSLANFFDISSTYNYWIELCSLIFLGCLFVRFLVGKKFRSRINLVFGVAILCGIFDLSLDILGSIFIANYQDVPVALNEFVNGAFYFFHLPFPVLLYTFLLCIAGISKKTWKKLGWFYIPAILYHLIILTNPFTNWVFDIDYSAVDGVFKHGPLFVGIYIVSGFYILLTFVSLFKVRNKIEAKLFNSMMFSIVLVVIMLAIQILVPNILLTGLAISLSCWANFEHLANAGDMIDKASGVFNYNAFLNFLKDDVRSVKGQNLIVCDVGSITEINSKLGVLTGNHVYKEIGNFFKTLNNGKAWAFRLYSSRFIIAFNDSLSLSAAMDDIENRFDGEWKVQDHVFDLTISGYLINGNLHANSAADFFDYLNALDNKIRSDVNKTFIHIGQREIEEIIRIKNVEKAVKRAMNNNFEGFVLNYQPIYEVSSKKFTRLEVLLRFKDPELGNVSPVEFIPIIERCGLAQRIDKFVLDSSCQFLVKHPEIESADINISGADFLNNPSMEFSGIVKKYGLDPKKICFEVTETATVAYPEIFEEFMGNMISDGFTFAIDDFGTGYSNVARVTDKSFSLIKLDMSFLRGNEKMTSILEAIVDLFHKLSIPMVIEGVETKEQLEYVKSLGIEYIQGWYFSKALPEDEFVEFVKNN